LSCIYALTEPDNLDEIRYIGKTKKSPEVRYTQHLKDGRDGYKLRWIRSLPEGKVPSLLVLEECPETSLNEREVYWIEYYKSLGYRLTNMSKGGDGGNLNSNYTRTKSHCENISKALSGKLHTEEHNQNIGNSVSGVKNGFYGKSHSNETKEHIRQRNIEYAENIKREMGSRFTPEQLDKMSARFRKFGEYYGVSKQGCRWRCRLYKDGKEIRFGVFDTQEEAAMAWDREILNYFPNAPLNFYEGELV
jgi:group I intron endonuclease